MLEITLWIMSPLGGKTSELILPATSEEINETITSLVGGGDWIIADYEAPFEISQYDDIHELNDLLEEIKDFGDYEMGALISHSIDQGMSLKESLESDYEEWSYLCDYEYEIQSSLFDLWCEFNFELVDKMNEMGVPISYLDEEHIVHEMYVPTIKTEFGIFYRL